MIDVIARQHLLPSSVWLANRLRERPDVGRIRFSGKHYSTVPSAALALQRIVDLGAVGDPLPVSDIDRLVLLDEGGELHRQLKPDLATRSAIVEQTTFGLRTAWKSPAVLVCRSAAKLLFEAQIIARGVLRKLHSLDVLEGQPIGIIGLGALGSAIARALLEQGCQVSAYEPGQIPRDLSEICVELTDLLHGCRVILGCTGSDALRDADLATLTGSALLISCSSAQVEFARLLGPGEGRAFETVTGQLGAWRWSIPNGGYPINFDRTTEWETFEEIVLTRELMLEGFRQATALVGSRPRGVMLNPAGQHQIVTAWLASLPKASRLRVPSGLSEKFLRDHSEGDYAMTDKPNYELHTTTPGALTLMRAHTELYEVPVMGLPIIVLPGVWSPAYDWSSLFYLENIGSVEGRSFLEIGSGSGIISVFAGRGGATRIVAADVNPAAIENTRLNFARFDIRNAEAVYSEGFSEVQGRFDVIVWNAPYHGCRPEDDLERGCADEDYQGIRAFFRDVKDHLAPGGRVVFGFSESGDLPLIESLIADAGLRPKRRLSDWRENYNCMLFELVVAAVEAQDGVEADGRGRR